MGHAIRAGACSRVHARCWRGREVVPAPIALGGEGRSRGGGGAPKRAALMGFAATMAKALRGSGAAEGWGLD